MKATNTKLILIVDKNTYIRFIVGGAFVWVTFKEFKDGGPKFIPLYSEELLYKLLK